MSKVMDEGWLNGLQTLLDSGDCPKHMTLVGVGNPIKQDDYTGLYVTSKLKQRYGANPTKYIRIASESTPESVLSELAKTKKRSEAVLIIDAVEANLGPGSIIFASITDTKYGFFATHNIPLKLISDFVPNSAGIYVLGIQPENLEIGEGLSKKVRDSADQIVERMSDYIDRMKMKD
jgi:hydrogenase 3 maturation protease